MIQRIQTLYLALATALAGFLLNGDIVKLIGEKGEVYSLSFKGISLIQNGGTELLEKSLPLTILMIIVPILLFVSILLFKNRKFQIRVTVFSTLLFAGVLILMLFYIFVAGKNIGADPIFNIKLVFPIAGIIFGYLAFRAILKDELLIKSYDRIR
jgi:hypothetical protein